MFGFISVEEANDNLNEKSDFANLQVVTEKGLKVFTFKQLHSATGGFSKSNIVGHGGFGLVYRGVLNDGRKVAIKLMDQAGKQGEEEFKVEVRTFSYALDLPCYQTTKICRIWIIMIYFYFGIESMNSIEVSELGRHFVLRIG